MNLQPYNTDDLLDIERYRELRVSGRALPSMPVPYWVANPPRTSLDMVRLPNLLRLEVSQGMQVQILFGLVGLVLLLIVRSAPSFFDSMSPDVPSGGFPVLDAVLLGGLAAACFLALNWADVGRSGYMTPEATSLEHHPGDTVLLMLPLRGKSTSYVSAQLQYQERWQVKTNDSEHWTGRVLQSMPVSFAASGATLLSAKVDLPAELPTSYHAEHYRLDWMLTIEHQPWWGTKRVDRYLLWISPKAEANETEGMT